MKKVYLICSDEQLYIVDTWDECKTLTHGVKGRLFKSFKKNEEHEMIKWFMENISNKEDKIKEKLLNDLKIMFDKDVIEECQLNEDTIEPTDNQELNTYISDVMEDDFIAFVDGSYCKDTCEYSYALCIVKDNKVYYEKAEKFNDLNGMRQINGELKGALMACRYAIKNNIKKLYIGYDYKGIEYFATKKWTTNKECIQFYIGAMQKYMELLDIHFIKIPAHKKVFRFNEYVDCLSKEVLGINNDLNKYK